MDSRPGPAVSISVCSNARPSHDLLRNRLSSQAKSRFTFLEDIDEIEQVGSAAFQFERRLRWGNTRRSWLFRMFFFFLSFAVNAIDDAALFDRIGQANCENIVIRSFDLNSIDR